MSTKAAVYLNTEIFLYLLDGSLVVGLYLPEGATALDTETLMFKVPEEYNQLLLAKKFANGLDNAETVELELTEKY